MGGRLAVTTTRRPPDENVKVQPSGARCHTGCTRRVRVDVPNGSSVTATLVGVCAVAHYTQYESVLLVVDGIHDIRSLGIVFCQDWSRLVDKSISRLGWLLFLLVVLRTEKSRHTKTMKGQFFCFVFKLPLRCTSAS